MSQSKKPTHDVMIAEEGNGRSYYTKIGSAWKHEKGEGFNIIVKPGLSVSGKLVVFPIGEKKEEEA